MERRGRKGKDGRGCEEVRTRRGSKEGKEGTGRGKERKEINKMRVKERVRGLSKGRTGRGDGMGGRMGR